MSSDLNTLICALKVGSADRSNEEVLNGLQALLGPHVRIRYDAKYETVACPQRDANAPFKHLNGVNVKRILLTADRNTADFSSKLMSQCNGAVLEFSSWKLLVSPPKMFNPRRNYRTLAANVENYDIYYVADGTSINLYYYEDKWVMSSTNGFDVGNYQWMGAPTYMEAFMEVAAMYPDFSFDRLDKTRAYSIGFHHKDFHPLEGDGQKLWFIQSSGADGISYDDSIGIPLQVKFELMAGPGLAKSLAAMSSTALSTYMFAAKSGAPIPIYYGMIFRAKNNDNSDYLLESALLKFIRNMMYDIPRCKYANGTFITHENRLNYALMRGYLCDTTRALAPTLFPQYVPAFRAFKETFDLLADKIIKLMQLGFRAKKENTRIDTLAFRFSSFLKTDRVLSITDQHGPEIVKDFLMNVDHLDVYYAYLIDTAE